jgi:LEA14-like dessication related protein
MRLWYWPVLCVLMGGMIAISGCSVVPKSPEVSVKEVTPTSFSFSDLSLNVAIQINNPNSFGINLKSLSSDVYYQNGNDWVYLSHGEKSGIMIEPGENEVTIPVTVSSAELLRSIAVLIATGDLTIQIRGTASPDFYGIAPNIPFTYTTTVIR